MPAETPRPPRRRPPRTGINDGQGHGHVKPRPDGGKARCGGPSMCSTCAAELDAAAAEWTNAAAAAERERTALYRERAHLVAFLAAAYPATLAYSDPTTPEWAVLSVEGPYGLMCWHIAPADLDLFRHVRYVPADQAPRYDGHSTAEKYERLRLVAADLAATTARAAARTADGAHQARP